MNSYIKNSKIKIFLMIMLITGLFGSIFLFSSRIFIEKDIFDSIVKNKNSANSAIWDGTTAQYFSDGEGTEASPYIITNAKEFALLSSVIKGKVAKEVIQGAGKVEYIVLQTAHYKLTSNIKLNDTKNVANWDAQAPANSWNPIGFDDGFNTQFRGIFEGAGNTVSGVYVKLDTSSFLGLFGECSNAVIKNISLVDSYIAGFNDVGGIAGRIAGTTIYNCFNGATIVAKGTNSNAESSAGGIVGSILWGNALIENCINKGNVKGNASHVGGIVGQTYQYSQNKISNCLNLGTLKGESTNVGGIMGNVHTNVVKSNNYYLEGTAMDGNNIAQNGGGNDTLGSLTADINSQTNSVDSGGAIIASANFKIVKKSNNARDYTVQNGDNIKSALNGFITTRTTPSNYAKWVNDGIYAKLAFGPTLFKNFKTTLRNYAQDVTSLTFQAGGNAPSQTEYTTQIDISGDDLGDNRVQNGSIVAYIKGDEANGFEIIFYTADYKIYAPQNSDKLFVAGISADSFSSDRFENLNLKPLDTSLVTSMSGMFSGCSSLASLDISNFDTSNATSMSSLFSDCSSLTELNVSSFQTSETTTMSSMFLGCSSLTRLDVSNFDTGKLTSLSSMFRECSSLTSLNLSNFVVIKSVNTANFLTDTTNLRTFIAPQTINSNIYLSEAYYDIESKNGYTTLTSREAGKTFTVRNTLTLDNGYDLNTTSIYGYYNSAIEDLPFLTRKGYEFDGWTVDGEPITNETVWNYTEDKTAVASWIKQSHFHDGVTFDNELNSFQATLGTEGQTTNYVLTSDITATDIINIIGTVNLCLNGYTIDMAGYYISGKNNLQFSVYNQDTESFGEINNGNISVGTIYIMNGTFTLYGGTISSGYSDFSFIIENAIAVYNGSCNLKGGKVTGKNNKEAKIFAIDSALAISDVIFDNIMIESGGVNQSIDALEYKGYILSITIINAKVGDLIAKNIKVDKVNLRNEGYVAKQLGNDVVVDIARGGLFDAKFYEPQIWDCRRSPAFPIAGRPFRISELKSAFNANMQKIVWATGDYVKFEKVYSKISDIPDTTLKNRIINSLMSYTGCTRAEIENAIVVQQIQYNSDGTKKAVLSDVGLIWALGDEGFLYTAMNGSYPNSGGVGTFVSFEAHKEGDIITYFPDKTPPVNENDLNGKTDIPSGGDPNIPTDSTVIFGGKVVDRSGKELDSVNVTIIFNGNTITLTTDSFGNFLSNEVIASSGVTEYVVKLQKADGANAIFNKFLTDKGFGGDNQVVRANDIYVYHNPSKDENGFQVTHKVSIVVNNADYGNINQSLIVLNSGALLLANGNQLIGGLITVIAKPANSTAQYTYAFESWSTFTNPISGDITITANFTRTLNSYTITWENEDGKVLETDTNVNYGENPSYDEDTPTKEQTAEYSYTFNGWTPTLSVVTGDIIYTAIFTETKRTYTVTWKNGEEILNTDTVEYGQLPSYKGSTPIKEQTAEYSYTFNGWTPTLSVVTGDIIYTATFTETKRTYTVTWKNGEEILDTDTVEYGQLPLYTGEVPTKNQTTEYSYTFNGWTPTLSVVTEDIIYTATFTETKRTYTITWKNGEEIVDTDTVEYGQLPSYKGSTPIKEQTAEYSYTFSGWTPTISIVTEDVTYSAVFISETRSYILNWDADGGIFSGDYTSGNIFFGATIIEPQIIKKGYKFIGWTPTLSSTMPAADTTYKAIWEKKSNNIETPSIDPNNPDDKDKIEGEVESEEGFDENTTLEVKVITTEKAEDTLTLPDGKEYLQSYNATLYVNGVPTIISEMVRLKIAKPANLPQAESHMIIIVENGVVVQKAAFVVGDYLVFDTPVLGDFAIIVDKTISPPLNEPTSLVWLIILLSIIVSLELVTVGILIKRNHDDKKKLKMHSLTGLSALLMMSELKKGEVTTLIILGIMCLGLGSIIIVLTLKNYQQKKVEDAKFIEATKGTEDIYILNEEDIQSNDLKTIIETANHTGIQTKINKKSIADFLENEFGENVIINRRNNYTSTKLPLADTHYTFKNGQKSCFAYVYELEGEKVFLLLKMNKDTIRYYKIKHPNIHRSNFPKSNKQWYSVIIDNSYLTSNDLFQILKEIVKNIE